MISKSFPEVPIPHTDNVCKIADFAELECLKQRDHNLSIADVASAMGLPYGEDDEDRTHNSISEAFQELEQRLKHCGDADGRYPFCLNDRGDLLRFRGIGSDGLGLNYLYLLLATRLNMRDERVHAGFNGTELFEELSKEVAVRYLGGPATSVGSVVYGTARFGEASGDDELDRHTFKDAVNSLCKQMGEGYGYKSHPDTRSRAKDDKLDVVAWRNFADSRSGKLIAFGQCKTGTHWDTELTTLQPATFCNNWMEKAPLVKPVRLFFVTDRVPRVNWSNRCSAAGILFDRCRITEYVSGEYVAKDAQLPAILSKNIGRWTRAAAKSKGLALR